MAFPAPQIPAPQHGGVMCGVPGCRAAGGTAVAVGSAGNWECCAILVTLQPCHLPSQRSFAPADTDTSVEPVGKVLLSKPPLATASRRRDQLSRGTAKGSDHALPRTRGQVLFPWAVAPFRLLQPSPKSPAAAMSFLLSVPSPGTVPCSGPSQLPLPPWKEVIWTPTPS